MTERGAAQQAGWPRAHTRTPQSPRSCPRPPTPKPAPIARTTDLPAVKGDLVAADVEVGVWERLGRLSQQAPQDAKRRVAGGVEGARRARGPPLGVVALGEQLGVALRYRQAVQAGRAVQSGGIRPGNTAQLDGQRQQQQQQQGSAARRLHAIPAPCHRHRAVVSKQASQLLVPARPSASPPAHPPGHPPPHTAPHRPPCPSSACAPGNQTRG